MSDMPSHHGVEVTPEREHPNETMRLLCERGSCRRFSKRKVPKEVMDAVLEAGTHAATAGNLQTYSVVKIEDPENRRWFRELGMQRLVEEAPVDLIFCIDFHRLKRWAELEVAPFTANDSFRHFWVGFQDAVIFAQTVCTAADAVGLGSVYVGTAMESFRELRERLRLPDHVLPVILVAMGYPEERPASHKKLGVDVVVHDEVYHDPDDEALLRAFEEKYTGPDSRRVEITEERIERIRKVCTDIHGEAFADRCEAKIRENGYISAVQRYFGLHYVANRMPTGNMDFLKTMEDFGFGWFKEYVPGKG